MRRSTKRTLPVAAAALMVGPWLALAPAQAASTTTYSADLTPLNGSGVHGTATATLQGDQLTVKINSTGLLSGSPHAQHIHIGGSGSCPSADAKGKGVDGHLRVSDAANDYGAIAVSLTTSGDTSPDSGLAVKRFPVGSASYSRTITVDSKTAAAIRSGDAEIVQHGVDYNGDGKYSGSAKSELDPSLPEEATDPAACGELVAAQMSSMPGGGVQTGGGSTSGTEDAGLIGLGAAMVAAGAGVVALRRRQSVGQRS